MLSRLPWRVRAVVWFVQRGRRGWADPDTWDFCSYLDKVVAGGLRHLALCSSGTPCGYEYDEWREALTRCADGLDGVYGAAIEAASCDERDRATDRHDDAVRWLAENWWALWN